MECTQKDTEALFALDNPEYKIIRDTKKRLQDKLEKKEFDDEYLELSERLRKYDDGIVEADIHLLNYWMYLKNYEKALVFTEEAFKYRKTNFFLAKTLFELYNQMGNRKKSLFYLGLLLQWDGTNADVPHNDDYEFILSIGSCVRMMPFSRPMIREGNSVHFAEYKYFGDTTILPPGLYPQENPQDGLYYFLGVYNENRVPSVMGMEWQLLMEKKLSQVFYCAFAFDLIRAQIGKEIHISDEQKSEFVLPIATMALNQTLTVSDGEKTVDAIPGLYEFNFYRFSGSAKISSEQPFALGKPIVMRHDKNRKKLVLNILVDAISWGYMKRRNFQDVPNLIAFFGKRGIVFNNNYTAAEWTIPSVGNIESGVYTHRTQIFHAERYTYLNKEYITISEQMNKLGYYCYSPGGVSYGVMHGALRGIDRHVFNWYSEPDATKIERAIRHIDAFSECDQYVYLHLMDSHTFKSGSYVPIGVQTKIPFADNVPDRSKVKSVFKKGSNFDTTEVLYSVREQDRALGELLRYVEEHYSEEDFVIHLYSDHGVSIFSDEPWLFTEEQTCSMLMMRGAGVPQLGFVEELTSAVDIYKIVGKNCGFPIDAPYLDGNLPAALGGKEREYVYSQSIYPGQTYKLAIRSREHEFRLESDTPTLDDGTVDMEHYTCGIYTRDAAHLPVKSDELHRKFLRLAYDFTNSFAQW